MFATWIADVLRGAGLTVVEHDGWQTRGHQDWTGGAPTAVVWHHDASAPGDSPGVPQFLVDRFDNPAGSAGLWVSRQGVWHVIAAGPAWHAGNVLPGKPGNFDSLGVEIDHTTGEDWPQEQLDGLRTGTRVLLARMGVGPDRLEFHRTIADPPGRKTDPDGLDLDSERAAIATNTTKLEEDEMQYQAVFNVDTKRVLIIGAGKITPVLDPTELKQLRATGLLADSDPLPRSQFEIDRIAAVLARPGAAG